ncbi:MAG: class I SAM-dependent methyltransferase [Deltaproteobacteria bacterium]|nr:class I SAM-dependent methyltransferase [Deltaproteobacteria bacterium]
MSPEHFEYVGSELELFREARNWKRYFAERLSPHLRGRVLEVGAGIGGTTRVLFNAGVERWVCLEPDRSMVPRIEAVAGELGARERIEVRVGTVAELAPDEKFDAILYIDVLEHIADDEDELRRSAAHLAPRGKLIVLSPAHQFLFSKFDEAVGHCRRYDRAGLRELTPAGLELASLYYLDSVGFAASLANRMLLKQSQPTPAQIQLWDRRMVPLSRIADRLLQRKFGKTIVGIWTRPA